jgi:hypothetical protein
VRYAILISPRKIFNIEKLVSIVCKFITIVHINIYIPKHIIKCRIEKVKYITKDKENVIVYL